MTYLFYIVLIFQGLFLFLFFCNRVPRDLILFSWSFYTQHTSSFLLSLFFRCVSQSLFSLSTLFNVCLWYHFGTCIDILFFLCIQFQAFVVFFCDYHFHNFLWKETELGKCEAKFDSFIFILLLSLSLCFHNFSFIHLRRFPARTYLNETKLLENENEEE